MTICEFNFSFFPTELEKMKKGESAEKVLYIDPLFESLFSIVVKVTDPKI